MTDTIHTAMLAIMGAVGYVPKSGQMQGGGATYRFAGEAEFIKVIRPAMVTHGVYCYPSAITDHDADTYTTAKGSVMNMDKARVVFTFVHAPSGTSIEVVAMGAGADAGDKAIPKMLTGALKYALRQAFLIETGDDPDGHSSDDQERGERRRFRDARPQFNPNPPSRPPTPPSPSLHDKLGVPIEWKAAFRERMEVRGLDSADVSTALKLSPKDFGEFYAAVHSYATGKDLDIDAMLDEITRAAEPPPATAIIPEDSHGKLVQVQ